METRDKPLVRNVFDKSGNTPNKTFIVSCDFLKKLYRTYGKEKLIEFCRSVEVYTSQEGIDFVNSVTND
jgi:hypothetical protein